MAGVWPQDALDVTPAPTSSPRCSYSLRVSPNSSVRNGGSETALEELLLHPLNTDPCTQTQLGPLRVPPTSPPPAGLWSWFCAGLSPRVVLGHLGRQAGRPLSQGNPPFRGACHSVAAESLHLGAGGGSASPAGGFGGDVCCASSSPIEVICLSGGGRGQDVGRSITRKVFRSLALAGDRTTPVRPGLRASALFSTTTTQQVSLPEVLPAPAPPPSREMSRAHMAADRCRALQAPALQGPTHVGRVVNVYKTCTQRTEQVSCKVMSG